MKPAGEYLHRQDKKCGKKHQRRVIDLGGGKTGYFSLAENLVPLYTDELNQLCSFEYSGNSEKKVSPRKLKAGDELLVQVSRDALKTKDPSVTCCLNFREPIWF